MIPTTHPNPANERPTLARPAMKRIVEAVAAEFALQPAILYVRSRARAISRPRQIVCWLARELTDLSFPQIGAHFGLDHTSVLYAQDRIKNLLTKDARLAGRVRRIRRVLEAAAT